MLPQALLAALLWQIYRTETEQSLAEQRALFADGYRHMVEDFRRVIRIAHAQVIDVPAVRTLLTPGRASDNLATAADDERGRRGRLYRMLYREFEVLRRNDIRVLQFVLPDGRSFLRMNRPDLFNDDIAADRPVLRQAIDTREAAEGFENGRVYPGYRFALPLFDGDRLLAVVDYSVSFDALQREFQRHWEGHRGASQFVLHRSRLEQVVHPSARMLFRDVALNPDFVAEDIASPFRDIQNPVLPPGYIHAIDARLAHDRRLRQAIDRGLPYARHLCLPGLACYAIALMPIPDSSGVTVGYMIIYQPEPHLWRLRGMLLATLLAASLLLTIVAVTLWRWLASRQRLRTISEQMAEGLFVTDKAGKILYANPAAGAVLGYDGSALLGLNAHRLHAHDVLEDRDRGRTQAHCPMQSVPMGGDVYRNAAEIFRRRDGSLLQADVVASPLRENGAITGVVVLFRDLTAERDAQSRLRRAETSFRKRQQVQQERLRQLAYHDRLTGLHNRNAFLEQLEHAIERAHSRNGQLALLFFDIDQFKRINDVLGHAIGDAVLRIVGTRVRSALQPTDELARLSADEFAIVLEQASHQRTAARVARSLLARLRNPIAIRGKTIHLSASIGIAIYPTDGADTTTLLRHAEAAMYLAKEKGRNRFSEFTVELAQSAERRFELEVELRQALEGNQFRLAYQPKVSLQDGSIIGLEALLRWQHPRRGLLGPAAFLDVARDTGLIQPITAWVVEQAARQCRTWHQAGLNPGRVSVNLDASFFQPHELEALLRQAMRQAGTPPAHLELEILETAMQADAETNALWTRLVEAGFELAIDDFGTGESSLARLKQLPAATLKIDRGFVQDIEVDANDRSIVRTIIVMAKTLGKYALAEGVETEAQLRFLMQDGCDVVQGYWFSPPVASEALPDLLRNNDFACSVSALRSALGLPQMTWQDARREQLA